MRDPFSLRGTAIDGRFRVDDVIGEGGFGVVYRGSHLKLDHPVAIKCLKIPDHFTADAKKLFLERFREEGRILLKLADIPGVPRLYDYEVHKTATGHEVPLLVMEWLDGKTVEDALAERKKSGLGPLKGSEAVAIMLPALDALATAHNNRIAHRDIKPANLFIALGSRGLGMKVLDFGIAKGMQEGESLAQSQTKTATNFRAFTPNYAAPEQFRPKQFGATGPWSDVYSLGLILVELMTGAPGNGGDDLVECLDNATSKDRPSPRARGVEVSDELEAAILKAVALKPEDRYADAGQLGDALSLVPEAKETTTKAGLKALFGEEPSKKRTKPGGPSGTEVVIVAGNTEVADHTPFVPTFPNGNTKEPVSKTTSAPHERKYGALIMGAAVIAGGGALVYALSTGDPKKAKVSEPETASTGAPSSTASGASPRPATPAKNGTVLAHSVFDDREILPVIVLSDADAKGKRHVKMTRDGDRMTVDHVDPAGKVFQTETITFADGGWESVKKNSRGQIAETTKRTKDGVETHVTRTGSPFVEGCARWSYKVSDKGDSIDRTCQDAKGHVIIDVAGCQIVRMEIDEKHQITSRRCLSADGTPLADAEGIHLKRRSYDERGNMTEEAYFGADDHTVATQGCARRRSEYDDAGNWVLHTCIGPSGLQTAWGGTKIVSNGYHYDANGCLLRAENLDADGKPVDEARIAAVVTKRDEHCSELAIEWRNAAKELVKGPLGLARRDNTLDAQGNVTEWRCYDAKNAPTNCWGFENPNDAQVVYFKYDDKGRELSKRYFDVKGNSTGLTGNYPHETRSVWDDKGLLLEKSYWNVDGKPAAALGNVGKRVFRYDPLGSMTSFACMGIDGAPVVSSGTGIHELKQTYDDKHRFTTIELFDLEGKPAANPTMAVNHFPFPTRAVKLMVAREGSRVVENVFYDKNGKVLEKGKIDCHDSSVPCMREPTGP